MKTDPLLEDVTEIKTTVEVVEEAVIRDEVIVATEVEEEDMMTESVIDMTMTIVKEEDQEDIRNKDSYN